MNAPTTSISGLTAKTACTLNLGGRLVDVSQPTVMGILNVTPDSFYAASRRQSEREIARRAEEIVAQGGTFVDVGAYSTRPGAATVSEAEETERLRSALAAVRSAVPEALLSVDTFRASVVQRMIDAFGPFLVNDVSGGSDPDMFPTVARLGLPYVLSHSPLGTLSATAIQAAEPSPAAQSSLVPSLLLYFSQRIDALLRLGQKDIILDPGFGFGKSLEENYHLLSHLAELHALELPLMVGVSRKSMVYRLLGTTPEEALNGTTALHALALERGAHILRVHDVGAAIQVIKILKQCSSPSV